MAARPPLEVRDVREILDQELAARPVVPMPALAARVDDHLRRIVPGRRESLRFVEKQLDQGTPRRALAEAVEVGQAAAVPLPRQTDSWAGDTLAATNFVRPPPPAPVAANEPELEHHLRLAPRQRLVATSMQMRLDAMGHDGTTIRFDPAVKHGFGEFFDIHFFQHVDAYNPLNLGAVEAAVADLYAPTQRISSRRTLSDAWQPVTVHRVAPTADFTQMINPYIGGHPAMPAANQVDLAMEEWKEFVTPDGSAPIRVHIRRPRTSTWRRELCRKHMVPTRRDNPAVAPAAQERQIREGQVEVAPERRTEHHFSDAHSKAWADLIRCYLDTREISDTGESGADIGVDLIAYGPGTGKTRSFVVHLVLATMKHTRGGDYSQDLDLVRQSLPERDEEIPYDIVLDLLDRWDLTEIPKVAGRLEFGTTRLRATMRMLTMVSWAEQNELARAREAYDSFHWNSLPRELHWMKKTAREIRVCVQG